MTTHPGSTAERSQQCHGSSGTLTVLELCFEAQWKTSFRFHRYIQKPSSMQRRGDYHIAAHHLGTNFLPAACFFKHHPLISATLSPPTRKAYTHAYNAFLRSMTNMPHNSSQLDKAISAYIEDNFSCDPSPWKRQKMVHTFCFLSIASPDLKSCLGLSRRALAG